MLSRRIASRLRDMETPFYLYDTELLRQTLESVVNESKRYNYKVHYAIKANYDDRLLAIIREYGLGVDCASGNVTAFVDNADPRSVFRSEELPAILRNPKILTINGVDKFAFASRFEEFAEKEASATLRTAACSA